MSHPPKEWTVMIYMAGDNNLSEDMITGLKGLNEAIPHHEMTVIAAYDSNYPPTPITLYDLSGQQGTRTPNPGRLRDREIPGKPSNQRPSGYSENDNFSIEDFVEKVVAEHPAKRYGLILSGHSDGILGRTLLRDENPTFVLDVVKLREILEKCLPKDEDGDPKRFDLLGFDGCLMSMIEVGYELSGVAKVLVGSQGNIPTAGWNLGEILHDFWSKLDREPEALAEAIVRLYADTNKDYDVSGRSVEISALNLSSVSDIAGKYAELGQLLQEILSLVPAEAEGSEPALSADRLVRDHFLDCIQLAQLESQLFMHSQSVDVKDFLTRLLAQSWKRILTIVWAILEQGEITATVQDTVISRLTNYTSLLGKIKTELDTGIETAVMCNDSAGARYQFSKGISVFFPWNFVSWHMVSERYKRFQFVKKTKWDELIEKRVRLTMRPSDKSQSSASRLSSLPGDLSSALELSDATSKGSKTGIDLSILLDTLINLFGDITYREHTGKEHTGKEHTGKGDDFYRYFARFQNFPPWDEEDSDIERSDDAEQAVAAS